MSCKRKLHDDFCNTPSAGGYLLLEGVAMREAVAEFACNLISFTTHHVCLSKGHL